MKTTHGIPCNDYRHTTNAQKERIDFHFVTTDRNTPSTCTVRIGDIDPMTGEPITNLTFFREYNKVLNNQVYTHQKQWKNQISIDAMTNDDGESNADRKIELSVPAEDPFGTDLPDDLYALREFASSLTGRQADIYDAILDRIAGGQAKHTMRDIAEKYSVHISLVYKEKDRIIRMIREAIETARKEQK